jgi:hypothetical protein
MNEKEISSHASLVEESCLQTEERNRMNAQAL